MGNVVEDREPQIGSCICPLLKLIQNVYWFLSLSRQAEYLVPGHGQPWPVADKSEAGGEEAVQKSYQDAVAGEAPAENKD